MNWGIWPPTGSLGRSWENIPTSSWWTTRDASWTPSGRVGPGMSSVRMLLPGLTYSSPPAQDKREILNQTPEQIAAVFQSGRVDKALSNAFFGLSPQMAAALCACFTDKTLCEQLNPEEKLALSQKLHGFYQDLAAGKMAPALALGEGDVPVAVYPFHPNLDGVRPMDTMWEALDALYESQDTQGRMQRHGAGIRRTLLNNIERCEPEAGRIPGGHRGRGGDGAAAAVWGIAHRQPAWDRPGSQGGGGAELLFGPASAGGDPPGSPA